MASRAASCTRAGTSEQYRAKSKHMSQFKKPHETKSAAQLPVSRRSSRPTGGIRNPGALLKMFEMAFITGVSLPPTSSRLALQPEWCRV